MTKPNTPAPRRVQARRWIALSTVAAAGIVAGAPVEATPVAGGTPQISAGTKAPSGDFQLAASTKVLVTEEGGEGGEKAEGGEGGEGGEGAKAAEGGEGGEGGEAGTASAGDAAFLAQLGFVEGHLRAGSALYAAGNADMAKSHMKHPENEIYADLAPLLDAHGAGQFDAELAALAQAVESGAPAADVQARHAAVLAAIKAARGTAKGGDAERFEAIVLMTRTAAEEYGVGVVNGKIANLHEYQDAWGFTETARAMAAEMDGTSDPKAREALAKIKVQFGVIATAFAEGLTPGKGVTLEDPSLIHAAAARMELAAYGVK